MLVRLRAPLIEAEQLDVAASRVPVEVSLFACPLASGAVGFLPRANGFLYVFDRDWILRHPNGAVTVCRRDVFRANYEPAFDDSPTHRGATAEA